MKTNSTSQSGFFNPRFLLALTLCAAGFFLGAASFAANPTPPGWSLITSPNTSATQHNYLSAVTCASVRDCWAAGTYYSGSVYQTLIEHWDGTSWAIVPSPNATTTDNNGLGGVTCASASDCWAVGNYTYYYNTLPPPAPCESNTCIPYTQTLIEHWDGTAWTIVASPNSSPTENNWLSSVACTSSSDCWAVGSYHTGSTNDPSDKTLIEHWDGNSWAEVDSPNCPGFCSHSDSLVAVTCVSGSDCWAVGDSGSNTLTEHWDGNSWSWVQAPEWGDESGVSYYYGVACTSASDCWVVGRYDGFDENTYGIIDHWNGTSWSAYDWSGAILGGVTCVSASECWGVGYGIRKWDGTSWAAVTSPSVVNGHPTAVSCASASNCWAVGSAYYNGSVNQTLIEEFAPTVPALIAVGSRKVHGGTPYDIDLLNASPGIECRIPGATGTTGVDHKIIFTFINNVTSCGTTNIGSLSAGPNLNQCTVNLTGDYNQQYVTVALSNVLDAQANTGNVSTTMGVLLGDVNASRRVDAADVSSVRQQTLQTVTNSNFRNDLNASGRIDAADVSIARQQTLTSLPSPP